MTEGKDRRLRQISRLRLVDEVCRSIEDAILSRQMRPGERLVETQLGKELGVSRTTVREALLMLERRGLVISEPRRGTFVTRLAPGDALELKVTRALLEGFALSIGYNRITDAALTHLEELLADMASYHLPADLPRLIQTDLAFHGLLIESAGLPRLTELWSSLNGQIGALILSGIERWHADTTDLVELHRVLLAAVRSRDPAVMREAVIEHYVRDRNEGATQIAAMIGVTDALAARHHYGSNGLSPDPLPTEEVIHNYRERGGA